MSDCGSALDLLHASDWLRAQAQSTREGGTNLLTGFGEGVQLRDYGLPEAKLVALTLDHFESVGVIRDRF